MRTGLIVAAVVGVILLGIVGIAVVGFVGSAVTFTDGVIEEGFAEGDGFGFDDGGAVDFGGELTVGDSVAGSVPRDGTYEVDLVVEGPGLVTIEVLGNGPFDAVAEVRDPSGETLAVNDDRGDVGATGSGDNFDPLIELELEPGTYKVRVRGFGNEAGGFEVRTF